MPFVIPRMRDARPEWQIRLALLLYDHLGDRGGMAKSRTIRLRQDRAGRGLDPGIFKGWRYWDGWIDDARMVIALLRDAEARGATLFPRIAATHAERAGGGRSEEHTSELQSLMRISYAVFCLKKKKTTQQDTDK